MRYRLKVKWYNLSRGLGFLENPVNPELDIAVFASDVQIDPPCLFPGDEVEVTLVPPKPPKEGSIRPMYGPRAIKVTLYKRFNPVE